MMHSSAGLAAPVWRPTTVKLPGKVFEIQPVDNPAQTLLELVAHLNGQLDHAQSLREQKFGLLTHEEKRYVDDAFQSTEFAIRHVATLLEPCRFAVNASDDSNLRSELMFTLRDGPGTQLTLTSLNIASQTMYTVVGVLFGKEGVNHAPFARSYSAEAAYAPPHYEESTISRPNRSNWLGRSDSINEVHEPASGVGFRVMPGDVSAREENISFGAPVDTGSSSTTSPVAHKPAYIHSSPRSERGAKVSLPVVSTESEELKRTLSDMPSKSTSYMASAVPLTASRPPRTTERSNLLDVSDLSTNSSHSSVNVLQGSAGPPVTVVTPLSPRSISDVPNQIAEPSKQFGTSPIQTSLPRSQPLAHQTELPATPAASVGVPRKPVPPKPRKPSSMVNHVVSHQMGLAQPLQNHSTAEQDKIPAEWDNTSSTARSDLPSQARDRSRQNETGYPNVTPLGHGLGILSQEKVSKEAAGRATDYTAHGNTVHGVSAANYVKLARPAESPRTTSIPSPPSFSRSSPRQPITPGQQRSSKNVNSIPEHDQKIVLIGPENSAIPDPLSQNRINSSVRSVSPAQKQVSISPPYDVPPLDGRRGLDSTLPEVVSNPAEEPMKRFIEFLPEAAPELYVHRSPEAAPEVFHNLVSEAEVLNERAGDDDAPEVHVSRPKPVDHTFPEVVAAKARAERPESVQLEAWNASMARRRPRRARPDGRGDALSPSLSATSSTTGTSPGSPQTIASLPIFTPRPSLDPYSPFGGTATGASRPRSVSDVESIRSVTSTTTSNTDSTGKLTGKARSQRWRQAQYEKFESL